jgi:hypothetical protein
MNLFDIGLELSVGLKNNNYPVCLVVQKTRGTLKEKKFP